MTPEPEPRTLAASPDPELGVALLASEALREARPRAEDSLVRAVGLGSVMGAVLGVQTGHPTLDRYELRGVLGSGAMGTVYRAHDPHLDREIALKVLEGVGGRTGVDAVAEARNIARIDHPNVVTVFDAGTADGRLWVAMQLVEGGTLTARARDPDLDLPDLLRWLLEAGEGLAAAHARGVVHRDVKPDNILIDARGVAKLADFGLASRESAAGSVLAGTPGFMAPEVHGGREASPHSDQYSWCASAVWLAEQQGVELDPGLRAVVDRGLRAAPEERWPSMPALLEALRSGHARRGDPQLRATIIERVETAWIDGVLAPSTRTLAPVAIPCEWRSELVAGAVPDSTGPSPERPSWPLRLDPGGKALERVFRATHGSLLVSGEPGAGKTTAVLAWVKRRLVLAGRHEEVPVPVVFGLASFRGRGHAGLLAWCVDQLVERYGLPRAAAQTWIDGGHAILVFDGLDEVPERYRDRAAAAVSELGIARGQPLVVVCRRQELEGLAEPLTLRGALWLPPLDDDTLRELGVEDAELADIDGRSRAPLWAALGLVGTRASSDATAAALDSALDRWIGDALDRGPSRVADRRGALEALATLMRRKGVSQLVLEDLQFEDIPAAGLRRAVALSWRVLASGAVIWAVAAAAVAGGRDPAAGVSFALAGLLAILIVHRGRPVKMVERLTWSWRRALAWMPISVAFSTASGLLFGLIERTPGMSAAVGVQFGVMIALVVGLEPSRLPATVEANAGFRTSLRHAGAIGLAAAACFGLFFSTLAVPLLVPLFGPPGGGVLPADLATKLTYELTALAGVVSLGVYGGRAAGRHIAVRLGLAAGRTLPLRLVPWLEELVSRGLMRRVGGAYQFVHPTVLERLAPAQVSALAVETQP